MSLSTTIDAMLAAGCSAEQIAAVVKSEEAEKEAAVEARRAAKRASNAERQRRYRNARNGVTECDGALSDVTERDQVSPEVSPNENITLTPILPLSSESYGRGKSGFSADFEEFYGSYPKRENRKGAAAKYETARRSGVSHGKIMAGLAKWRAKWDAERTERQFIPAPDVWLNKAKFDDEVTAQARAGPAVRPTTRNGKPSLSDFARAQDERINGTHGNVPGDDAGEICPIPHRQLPGW